MPMRAFYYLIKPLIPRWLQIEVRRRLVAYNRGKYVAIWPIDPNLATPPNGWLGWPNGKRFAIVLQHDVESAPGRDKCLQLMDLEEKLGFRSAFCFVPEKYEVEKSLLDSMRNRGFDICVHGLKHDGKLFMSREIFDRRAVRINHYLKTWGTKGFTSPSMHHNFRWMHALKIEYATCSFDTDPFEPQPDGVGTIFPFWVANGEDTAGYVELPYTLPQDHSLFVIMQEKTCGIWKQKLDWIAEHGGMVLLNSHPDYMNFDTRNSRREEYAARYYSEFLAYIKEKYQHEYWHVLPNQLADHFRQSVVQNKSAK